MKQSAYLFSCPVMRTLGEVGIKCRPRSRFPTVRALVDGGEENDKALLINHTCGASAARGLLVIECAIVYVPVRAGESEHSLYRDRRCGYRSRVATKLCLDRGQRQQGFRYSFGRRPSPVR